MRKTLLRIIYIPFLGPSVTLLEPGADMKKFLKSRKGRFSLRQSQSGTRSASKDFLLTVPVSNQGWPEDFGFRLGGNGPSYILSVDEGSSAHMAGLQPGDQVLEIEGQNVSSLSKDAVIALAKSQKSIPPSIGVVSRIQQMDISPGPDGRFGFTIVGDCPLLVEDCLPNSPAEHSGLRAGDYVLEVNGIPVRQHETAAAMIKASQGCTLRLGVLRPARRSKRLSASMKETSTSMKEAGPTLKETSTSFKETSTSMKETSTSFKEISSSLKETSTSFKEGSTGLKGLKGLSSSLKVTSTGLKGFSSSLKAPGMGLRGSNANLKGTSASFRETSTSIQSSDSVREDRTLKALEFNKKVEEVLKDAPEVKEKLFEVLKQYASERKEEKLASSLPDILIAEEHRELIDSVRHSSALTHPGDPRGMEEQNRDAKGAFSKG
ncbi:delphilin-like [Arapaima gigas]